MVRKYIIVCNNKVIARGESMFYDDFRPLVPEGYRYVWAWNTKEFLTINVMRHADYMAPVDSTSVDKVNMAEWTKARRDYYRMTF